MPTPSYNIISKEIIEELKSIVGEQFVALDEESLYNYGHDETEDLVFNPEVVVKPGTPEEISAILKLCNRTDVPLTPRGAGTGLSGGALPVEKGILLSTERLNKIVDVDERNLQATVEPAVITQVFQETVEKKGLFYPPDPSSRGSCSIGGNLAESAGGPRAVKYGVTKDYVINLEVVLPDGEIIWTGANTLKNSTGYNLTQLMVGSEGTLGIITKAVFRLIPKPKEDLLMLVPFRKMFEATSAVSDIFRAGITPCCLEFMERNAIDWTLKFHDDVAIKIEDDIEAHLLVGVDGNNMDVLFDECEKINQVLEKYDCGEVLFADDSKQKDELWKIRRSVGEAVKSNSVYKEEDTVVPRAELTTLLTGVKNIGEKYGFQSVCYGHAGDGNLHINIVKGEMSDHKWNNELSKGITELFELTVSLGGTLSGEHGIGYVQRPYIGIAFNDVQLGIMKGIKNLFDPNYILNPSKIF